MLSLRDLRRYAVARSIFPPTSLMDAIRRLGGFVQADPLRAPARAQDLTLRHRVRDFAAGDLERQYPDLPLQEDFFINYGFLTPHLRALMHPREPRRPWDSDHARLAQAVLEQVESLGEAHPAQVDAALNQGTKRNWFGGNSRLSTELLDGLHHRGKLDVARRINGTRCYSIAKPWGDGVDPHTAMDAMADALVQKYSPLPGASLSQLISMLSNAAYQWRDLRKATLARAKNRLRHATVEGEEWYWPADEEPSSGWRVASKVRLLAPFDPLVWDRRRFERLWGWPYRFEAYTPAAKRLRGHYALPLLWRDDIIGWANLKVVDGQLQHELGFVNKRPAGSTFTNALDEDLAAMGRFLGA